MENQPFSFRTLLFITTLIGLWMPTLHAQTVLMTESFETDGEGARYTSNTFMDCASEQDVFMRTNMNPLSTPTCGLQVFGTALTGMTGSFMWVLEDIKGSTGACINCRPAGDITSSAINITSYNSLQFLVDVACSNNNNLRWESADSINIQVSINGAAFRTVGRFMGKGTPIVGANLGIDSDLDGAITGADPVTNVDVANFTTYTFNIPGTGTNLRWKLDCDQQGGSEEMGIDNIRIVGTLIVPVRWANFTAQMVDQSVKLDWGTTEEVNVREFVVERAASYGEYAPIGTVAANGSPSSYSFVDPNPHAGFNIYRIKQVDIDNATSFSEAVDIRFTPTFDAVLFPNPTSNGARLEITRNPVSGTLHLVDHLGKIQRSIPFVNATSVEIPRGNLTPGMYYVRVDLVSGRSFTKKLVIQD